MKKLLTIITLYFTVLSIGFLGCSSPAPLMKEAKAEKNCSSISGKWVGSKEGTGYEGDVKLNLKKDCSYILYLGDEHICNGDFSNNKDNKSFDYAQDCGSKGTVEVDGDNMTWVNTYTGNSYEVKLKKGNR